MIQHMAYFRFKYRTLPTAYRRFLSERLEPGGTVVVVDCGERWPTTEAGERQVFQHGAVGGASPQEYAAGGERVTAFLAEQGSELFAWDGPAPDAVSPEAEWGFDATMLPELTELCAQRDWTLERLTFPRADAVSGPVAELYRAWYTEQGVPANRLLVGSFVLIDVHLPLARGLVPYWALFGTRPSRDTLDEYLRNAEPYDEIHLGLFSHGIRSLGLATIDDWDEVLRHARRSGAYCGVDRDAYPQDFASNGRFHDEVAKLPTAVEPPPGRAPWAWVMRWLPALRLGNP